MSSASPIVVVFAKYPEPGRVKTRLIGPLTAEQAADVHRRCLQMSMATVTSISPLVKKWDASPFWKMSRSQVRGPDSLFEAVIQIHSSSLILEISVHPPLQTWMAMAIWMQSSVNPMRERL